MRRVAVVVTVRLALVAGAPAWPSSLTLGDLLVNSETAAGFPNAVNNSVVARFFATAQALRSRGPLHLGFRSCEDQEPDAVLARSLWYT